MVKPHCVRVNGPGRDCLTKKNEQTVHKEQGCQNPISKSVQEENLHGVTTKWYIPEWIRSNYQYYTSKTDSKVLDLPAPVSSNEQCECLASQEKTTGESPKLFESPLSLQPACVRAQRGPELSTVPKTGKQIYYELTGTVPPPEDFTVWYSLFFCLELLIVLTSSSLDYWFDQHLIALVYFLLASMLVLSTGRISYPRPRTKSTKELRRINSFIPPEAILARFKMISVVETLFDFTVMFLCLCFPDLVFCLCCGGFFRLFKKRAGVLMLAYLILPVEGASFRSPLWNMMATMLGAIIGAACGVIMVFNRRSLFKMTAGIPQYNMSLIANSAKWLIDYLIPLSAHSVATIEKGMTWGMFCYWGTAKVHNALFSVLWTIAPIFTDSPCPRMPVSTITVRNTFTNWSSVLPDSVSKHMSQYKVYRSLINTLATWAREPRLPDDADWTAIVLKWTLRLDRLMLDLDLEEHAVAIMQRLFTKSASTFSSLGAHCSAESEIVVLAKFMEGLTNQVPRYIAHADSEDFLEIPLPHLFAKANGAIETVRDVADAPGSKMLTRLVECACTIPMYMTGKTDESDLKKFSKNVNENLEKSRYTVSSVSKALLFSCELAYHVHNTGSYSKGWSYANYGLDKEFEVIVKYKDAFEAGEYADQGLTQTMMIFRIEQWMAAERKKQKNMNAKDKFKSEEKLTYAFKFLKNVRVRAKMSSGRIQHFALFIHGRPGIGKSKSIDFLEAYLHQLTGLTDIAERGNIIAGAKYDDAVHSTTTLKVLDDLGNTATDKRMTGETEASKVIRHCSSITQTFVKAGVDEKGVAIDNSVFVIATSNTHTAGLETETVDLESMARRFQVKVDMAWKDGAKEFLKDTGVDYNGLHAKYGDPSDTCLPKWATYTLYNFGDDGVSGKAKVTYLTQPLEAEEFIAHLGKTTQKYFTDEIDAINSKNRMLDTLTMCPHNLPSKICNDCLTAQKLEEAAQQLKKPADLSELKSKLPGTRKDKQTTLKAESMAGAAVNLVTMGASLWSITKEKESAPWAVKNWLEGVMVNVVLSVNNSFFYYVMQFIAYRHTWWAIVIFRQVVVLLVQSDTHDRLFRCIYLGNALFFGFFTMLHARDLTKRQLACVCLCYSLWTFFLARNHRAIAVADNLFLVGVVFCKWLNSYYAKIVLVSRLYLVRSQLYYIGSIFNDVLPKIVFVMSAARASKDILRLLIETLDTFLGSFDAHGGGIEIWKEKSEKEHSWSAVVRQPMCPNPANAGTQTDHLMRKLENNLCTVEFVGRDAAYKSNALFLSSGIMVMPYHSWEQNDGIMLEATLKVTNGRKVNTVTIRRQDCYIEQDLIFLNMPGFGSKSDLRKHMAVEKTPALKNEGRWLRYNEDGAMEDVPITLTADDKVRYNHPKRQLQVCGYAYSMNSRSKPGHCGSPIIRSGKHAMLVGIHIAGSNMMMIRRGAACTITTHSLMKAFSVLNTTGMITTRDTPVLDANDQPMKVDPTVHAKHPLHFMPQDVAHNVIGDIGKTHSARNPVVVNENVSVAEKHVMDNPNFTSAKMWAKASYRLPLILTGRVEKTRITPHCLVKAIDDYLPVPAHGPALRPYTLAEVCSGSVDHKLKALDLTTSFGPPHNNSKKNHFFVCNDGVHRGLNKQDLQSYNNAMQRLSRGETTGHYAKAHLKGEPVAKEKNARIFYSMNAITQIIATQYFGPIVTYVLENNIDMGLAMGTDPHAVSWHKLTEKLSQKGAFEKSNFSIDYSKWDATYQTEVATLITERLIEIGATLGYDAPALQIMIHLSPSWLEPIVDMDGALIRFVDLLPSGCFLTTFLNSVGNQLLIRASFYNHAHEGALFSNFMFCVTMGDDNTGKILEALENAGWSLEKLVSDLEEWGYFVTNSSKDSSVRKIELMSSDEVDFLKRKTYYNKDIGHRVGVLNNASELRPFYIGIPSSSVTPREQNMDCVETTITSFARRGREQYEEMQTRLNNYVENSGYGTCELLQRSYDDCIDLIKLEYPLQPGQEDVMECPIDMPNLSNLNAHSEGPLEEVTRNEVEQAVLGETSVPRSLLPAAPETELPRWLQRSVRVATLPASVGHFLSHTFDPYTLFFEHPSIAPKVTHFARLKTDMKVEFKIVSSSGHYGGFRVCFIPMHKYNLSVDPFSAGNGLSEALSSQLNHVDFSCTDSDVSIVCPYTSNQPAVWNFSRERSSLGRVNISSLTSLRHSMGSTASIAIEIWISAVNLSLTGATMEAHAEKKISDYVSAAGQVAEVASHVLGAELAVPSKIVAKGAKLAAGVLRSHGFSRPMQLEADTPRAMTSSLASSNLDIVGKKLSLDSNQAVALTNNASDGDPLLYNTFHSRWTQIATATVSSTMLRGHELMRVGVTPLTCVFSENGRKLVPAACAIPAMINDCWRGPVKYRFTVYSHSSFGGALQISYDPRGHQDEDSTLQENVFLDIEHGNNIETIVHYSSPRASLSTRVIGIPKPLSVFRQDVMNGELVLRVASPLVGLTPESTYADVIVEMSVDARMLLYRPSASIFSMFANLPAREGVAHIGNEVPNFNVRPDIEHAAFSAPPRGEDGFLAGVQDLPRHNSAPETDAPTSAPTGAPTTMAPTSAPSLRTSAPTLLPCSVDSGRISVLHCGFSENWTLAGDANSEVYTLAGIGSVRIPFYVVEGTYRLILHGTGFTGSSITAGSATIFANANSVSITGTEDVGRAMSFITVQFTSGTPIVSEITTSFPAGFQPYVLYTGDVPHEHEVINHAGFPVIALSTTNEYPGEIDTPGDCVLSIYESGTFVGAVSNGGSPATNHTKMRTYCRARALPENDKFSVGFETGFGNGEGFLYAYASLRKKTRRGLMDFFSEVGEKVFQFGTYSDEKIVALMCAGERIISLRSHLKSMPLFDTKSVNSSGAFEDHIYGPSSDRVFRLFDLLNMCHLGCRGSMVYTTYGIGEGFIICTRGRDVSDSWRQYVTHVGLEITDSRINPSITVCYPYTSSTFFTICRGHIIDPFDALNTKLVITEGISELLEFRSVGEDFNFFHFQSTPILDLK